MNIQSPIKETKINTKPKITRPKMYKVIMFNDNITPYDCVLYVLMDIFGFDGNKALQCTRDVEIKGNSIILITSYDNAMTKKNDTMVYMTSVGFPDFKIEIEEE